MTLLPAPVFSPHTWTTQSQARKRCAYLQQSISITSEFISVLNNCPILTFYSTLLQHFITMEACVTKVALHISCKGLLDKDSFSKSDPLCAVYIQQGSNWTEVLENMLMHERLIFILLYFINLTDFVARFRQYATILFILLFFVCEHIWGLGYWIIEQMTWCAILHVSQLLEYEFCQQGGVRELRKDRNNLTTIFETRLTLCEFYEACTKMSIKFDLNSYYLRFMYSLILLT